MAYRNNTTYRNSNASRRTSYADDYQYGNAVRKQEFVRQLEEPPRRVISNSTRKNREKAHHMSLGYVVFLIAALCCAGVVLVNYLQLQSQVTRRAEIIASRESELNNLRLSNDEALNRIESSIDLEEIRRIAIGELGMVYASEGQIESYTNEGNDYFRSVAGN